jgi:hypothetical protein
MLPLSSGSKVNQANGIRSHEIGWASSGVMWAVGHMAPGGENRNANKVEHLYVDGVMLLKWVLNGIAWFKVDLFGLG